MAGSVFDSRFGVVGRRRARRGLQRHAQRRGALRCLVAVALLTPLAQLMSLSLATRDPFGAELNEAEIVTSSAKMLQLDALLAQMVSLSSAD